MHPFEKTATMIKPEALPQRFDILLWHAVCGLIDMASSCGAAVNGNPLSIGGLNFRVAYI